ncbi:MAG: preprotein translocase subunit SecY [Bdellovibrionales bacterium RIFOXYD12_FULL_39_22]|nr:MAG: preprotein translocase subunit SecY [Bdellovibrionales bacterium RIFOXYB1_FULL_39_21]OFZ43366.1 MAG: preprotein translocase subunit SecY [Bdellovibrionales bacterium RIFOXYC12_FULL_39_17]OFZ47409.1 MAG: preprotein translocase subunit SecY [Bdellovibrionales bacterium RIFOXYC1_FULL_39_130]OFZ76289.1 MAG: preprotein translocase subunit SecY [Bdellovibrionales bacterium RIFOXYD1_FULL_39_84]OFZ94327.1 MAG: preprotein translocase subunit SecY [Bdellovibrionales bacterium RIFOXYD12_FULL_39_22
MTIAHGKLEELKTKIFFTFMLLVVFRIASQVPVPGVDAVAIKAYFSDASGGFFDLINTFSGGAFKRFSVVALGIMPYITTSIIFSLLGEVIPQIQELQEDADGHKKIQRYVRYFTVLLCSVQGYGMAAAFETFKAPSGAPVIPDPGMLFRISTMITLTAGTMFLLWLGERITEYGLENGVSLIIFAGIAVALPSEVAQTISLYRSGEILGIKLLISFAMVIFTFYFVAYIESAFRAIPVQYAKKVVHNRVYGGTQTLPVRVDTAGVMPPILASSLLAAPATFTHFISPTNPLKPYLDTIQQSLYPGQLLFNLLFAGLIVYMTYFYAPIQFKTKKITEMLQKNNAFVPGIRPGSKTKEYLDFILFRVSFFGAIFLVIVCIVPTFAMDHQTRFGGTSMLILVSVAIRVMMNVQSFLYADRYSSAYKSRGKYSGSRRF